MPKQNLSKRNDFTAQETRILSPFWQIVERARRTGKTVSLADGRHTRANQRRKAKAYK